MASEPLPRRNPAFIQPSRPRAALIAVIVSAPALAMWKKYASYDKAVAFNIRSRMRGVSRRKGGSSLKIVGGL